MTELHASFAERRVMMSGGSEPEAPPPPPPQPPAPPPSPPEPVIEPYTERKTPNFPTLEPPEPWPVRRR